MIVALNNQMKKSNHYIKQRKLSKTLLKIAMELVTDSPSSILSRSFRNILFDYISQNKDCLPLNFDSTINDLNKLFAFLDAIEDEFSKEH